MVVFQNLRKPQNYKALAAQINADANYLRLSLFICGSIRNLTFISHIKSGYHLERGIGRKLINEVHISFSM